MPGRAHSIVVSDAGEVADGGVGDAHQVSSAGAAKRRFMNKHVAATVALNGLALTCFVGLSRWSTVRT